MLFGLNRVMLPIDPVFIKLQGLTTTIGEQESCRVAVAIALSETLGLKMSIFEAPKSPLLVQLDGIEWDLTPSRAF